MLKTSLAIILILVFLLAFTAAAFSGPQSGHAWQDDKNLDNESADPAPAEDGSGDSDTNAMSVLFTIQAYLEYVIS